MATINYNEACEKPSIGKTLNYGESEESARHSKLYYIPDTEGKITNFSKFITSGANRFLLKKKNSKVKGDLVKVIMEIEDTTPSKVLIASNDLRRVKWRDYRIIYKVVVDVIIILSIGLRKNCYKKLKKERERFLRLDYTSCQPFEFSSYYN